MRNLLQSFCSEKLAIIQAIQTIRPFCYLPPHIYLRPRFKFHLKPLIVNRDLLNQPPYQQFIILRDLGRLLFQKLPHLPDSLFQSFPLGALHQGILLQFPQPVNLICNTVIILFRIRQFQKFLLQFQQLGLNPFR